MEIEDKMIEIRVGPVKPEDRAEALAMAVGLPDMSSREGNKKVVNNDSSGQNKDIGEAGRSMGLFEQSPSSTFIDL